MLLFSKLGCSYVADIAHKSLEGPARCTVDHKMHINPLRLSPGYPTMEKMIFNLGVCFQPEETISADDSVEIALMILIDELKAEECLCWEQHTNMILGVCHEHENRVSLEFCSMAEVDMLLAALTSKDPSQQVHIATEVHVCLLPPFLLCPNCGVHTLGYSDRCAGFDYVIS